jgi:hypothetical protein
MMLDQDCHMPHHHLLSLTAEGRCLGLTLILFFSIPFPSNGVMAD